MTVLSEMSLFLPGLEKSDDLSHSYTVILTVLTIMTLMRVWDSNAGLGPVMPGKGRGDRAKLPKSQEITRKS